MKRCFEEISENYDDYINIVILVLNYIDECYTGERNPAFLKQGSVVHFADGDCEILSISDSKEQILLKLPSGDGRSFSVWCAVNQLQYDDRLDITTRRLAKIKSGFSEKIYNDIRDNSMIKEKNTVRQVVSRRELSDIANNLQSENVKDLANRFYAKTGMKINDKYVDAVSRQVDFISESLSR